MFSWNIAKSAEAVFSRWAVKRVCRFLLKKKLGKFILGDIDLEQLDVQLSDGTIQLSDLAVNVDYLNEKFDAPLLIKEGSIGSLLVKMPWKSKGCQVEVDELEVILAPRLESISSTVNESSTSNQEASHAMHGELGKNGHGLMETAAESASIDVHEGVKTVAKIVKWFLTSFHVKIKKLIIAFDPCLDKEQSIATMHTSLVFRMSEIECGTCVLEDSISSSDARAENFLGISRLTNFVKFQGAVLELLQMDDDINTSESSNSIAVTPIMTRKGGGFSGSLNLSIPWKHGSLDIRKVDADLCIDPMELRIRPATIKWFLHTWETCEALDLGHSTLISHFDSPAPVSVAACTEKVITSHDHLSSSSGQESENETALPGLQFITDWVPSSFIEKGEVGEVDFGASVDQFFECFDGMRSYQSALGSSAMWNWTSSVFTAITAASSLASGSLHLPSDQQHAQTSFKLSVSGISVVLFFHDEDYQKDDCMGVQFLGAECRNIFVSVQVCPQEMRLEGEVNNIEIADYFQDGSITDSLNIKHQTSLIKNLQDKIQSALPPFVSCDKNTDPDKPSEVVADGFLSQNKHYAVKTVLVRAPGATQFFFTINSQSSGGNFTGSKSFSLSLPSVIFWLHCHLIQALGNLLDEVSDPVAKVSDKNNRVTLPSYDESVVDSGPCITSSSSSESLRGNISISTARVILCFAFERDKENLCNLFGEQFIVINFSSPKTSNKILLEDRNPEDPRFASAACCICFSIGDVSLYLVTSDYKNVKTNSYDTRGEFSACKILYSSNTTVHQCSTVTMLWYDAPVPSRWLLEKAKFLATLEESMQSNKFMGEGHEFAAVTTAKDMEDIYSQTRKEITSGSTFCLHTHFLSVTIQLGILEYRKLHHLLDQFKSSLSCVAKDTADGRTAVCQTSIIVECDSVEILVRPKAKEDIKISLQSELPGSWHQFKLRIQKFNLLSVSNIGGIHGADFFWLAHREGKLWGSVTSVPDQELLLISCSNSMSKRGNGGGSNALSSRLAGSDIVYLQDPRICHGYLSISLRCSTIVAPGGRLDWFDAISSFFILPPAETEHPVDNNLQGSECSPSSASSFILNMVDVGLSYEPHFKNLEHLKGSDEPWIACLLAASSFNLSNTTLADSMSKDYRIRVQDLGFLLSMVSDPSTLSGTYSVEYLREAGYAKVAQEALVEATLRTNCVNGLLWELECSKSHLFIETCHDTTSGLIRLAAQLQQLFAPDLEQSSVYLQTRWNSIQQAYARNDFNARSGVYSSDSSGSQLQCSRLDAKDESGLVGLMDVINDDAFHFDGNLTCQIDLLDSQNSMSLDERFDREACNLVSETPDIHFPDQFICGLPSETVPESSQSYFHERDCLPELIENYCLSDLHPQSELSLGRELSGKHPILEEFDTGKGSSGWYNHASLRIVEDHVSETSEQGSVENSFDGKPLHFETEKSHHSGKAVGRFLLENINVRWRMYSGFDWNGFRMAGESARNTNGRDRTVFLELELSGMQCQYDVFPVGGICLSMLSVSVQDLHLYDRSKAAPWKLVLGYYSSKDHPRESSSKAFKLDLESVRPDPQTPLEEYRLRIAFLPLLLHLHQSQLDFLVSFFGAEPSDKPLVCFDDSGASTIFPVTCDHIAGHNIIDEALLPYFQKIDIWPVTVRVDYCPHHVDLPALSGGKYAELVNLVPWKGVELQLKHVHAAGIYGWGSVCETIVGEWLEDISQNQIHKLLQGIPTIRSLFALYSGAAQLVSSPVECYRKDRRVVKGVQRGTMAFLRSISLEAVGLGVHLAAGFHDILMRAEYILASGPSLSQLQARTKSNVRHNQPKNARQGIRQAYESIGDGLGKSASALVRTPLKNYQRGGTAGSALATAVRGVPSAAIAPASACASAVHSALVGIRNSLDPERKKESIEKYLGPEEHRNQN